MRLRFSLIAISSLLVAACGLATQRVDDESSFPYCRCGPCGEASLRIRTFAGSDSALWAREAGRVVILVESGWGPRTPLPDVLFRADTSLERFRSGEFVARTDARGVAVLEVPAGEESWIGAYLFGYEHFEFSVDPWYGGTDSVHIRLRQSQNGENCIPVLPGAP